MDAMTDGKEWDATVIGAGISGIYSAKFYLDIHPNAKVLILDRDTCLGGTWNSRRGYESFWTQWTVGAAEFSDFPMPQPPKEDLYYDFFKAKHTTKYLEAYADHHRYAGSSIRDRVRFGAQVQSVLKEGDRWSVSVEDRATGGESVLHTKKLIVASGLTSIAKMPHFDGQKEFGGAIIHQEDFGSSHVLASNHVKNITVLGGGKSSGDMAYSAIKAEKSVSWILKATDTTGPGFFFSPKGKGPYKNAFAVGLTRFASILTPSVLNGDNWFMRLLHQSRWGVKLVGGFWGMIDAEARKDANFERENVGGFGELEPHSSIFWQNGTGGLLNQVDFFNTIASNAHIHTADILKLTKNAVLLKNGQTIASDAILCGTGWVPSLQFFTQEQCKVLGLPHKLQGVDLESNNEWQQIEQEADAKVVTSFPILKHPPPHFHIPISATPYRLYKNIIPLPSKDGAQDNSIVFIGHVCVGNYFPAVQSQVMWATAYMDGKLELPSAEEQRKEVALFRAWCRRRYLSNGEEGNNMTFEMIGYIDDLLKDLGLKSHRKGWFRDWFAPNTAETFGGLKDEYVRKYGCDAPQ